MALMRETLVHAIRIEIPHRGSRHDIESEQPRKTKVYCRVTLLHEAVLFLFAPYAGADGERKDDALHEKLARERKYDNVEGHETEVRKAFVVVCLIAEEPMSRD